MMHDSSRLNSVLGAASLCWFASVVDISLAVPPNIVVIVADDLGYADVSFNPQHSKEVTTPHLAALANESVICRQGYVTGHVCSPTRAGLMTGRYQQRLGLYTGGEAGSGLPMNQQIFPQYLKPAGYATCQLGKWHLGPTPEWSPALRGFDEVYGFLGRGAHDYFKLDDPDDPIFRGTIPIHESGYLTDRLGDEAVAFIDRNKALPLFIYLAFNAVHAPLQAPAEEVAKFHTENPDRNKLLAMGKRMDDAIGRLVAKLKRENVWNNTLLFFISDNGGPLAQTADNTPLRGGKHQDYEGGIRVPFLVSWAAQLKPGESQAVVSSLDILPTSLAAAGLPLSDLPSLDGINLLPILRGDLEPPPRNLFWSAGGEEGWWAVRASDWKLVGEKQKTRLFQIQDDVSEQVDLAATMPDKVAELTAIHDAWLAEMAEPIKGGGKRFGLEASDRKSKTKKVKKATTAAPIQSEGKVMASFATLPSKPWKTPRGKWEARDGASWGLQPSGDKQQAKLTGPSVFLGGELSCEFNLAPLSEMILRFKDASDDVLVRVSVSPNSIWVARMTGENADGLTKAEVKLDPNTWHSLKLRFDGPELVVAIGETKLIVSDSIVATEKAAIDFLITQGPIGIRNFALEPAISR